MFYRDIGLPSVLEIGKHICSDLDSLLKKNHIFFEKKVLVTQKNLLEIYDATLQVTQYYKIILISGGKYEEVNDVVYEPDFHDVLFVAFGGGSVIDFVKMFATKYHNSFVTIPSTLSNDAIYSPISRLTVGKVKKSFGVNSPIGIIVDIDIVEKSSLEFFYAGIGDLVSNLSALKDCKLAIEEVNEDIDSFSMYLSKISAESVFQIEDIQKDFYLFVERLSIGLILSGLSMILSKSSRPASGAEHLISHAIDEFFPERSTLHGIQVAWAHLMLEKHIRKDIEEFERINNFYNKIGVLKYINQTIDFNYEEFLSLLPLAKSIRNRYTIIDCYLNDSNERNIK